MKVFIIYCILFISIGLNAQGSISGNFSPAKDFKWLIAYELTPGGERYTADTAVKDGSFSLEMPINAQPGMPYHKMNFILMLSMIKRRR